MMNGKKNQGICQCVPFKVAQQESNSGYRLKQKGPDSSASGADMVYVSAVVCIPNGINTNRQLNKSTIPREITIVEYENCGLAIRATEDKELKFGRSWSAETCEGWLHDLLPRLFQHVDKRNGGNGTKKSGLRLLSREGKQLLVVPIQRAPMGRDLAEFKGRSKAGVKDSKIIFTWRLIGVSSAFKKQIKPQDYEAWEKQEQDADVLQFADEDNEEREGERGDKDEDQDQDQDQDQGSSDEEPPVHARKQVVGKRRKRVKSDTSGDEAHDPPPPCKCARRGANTTSTSQVEPLFFPDNKSDGDDGALASASGSIQAPHAPEVSQPAFPPPITPVVAQQPVSHPPFAPVIAQLVSQPPVVTMTAPSTATEEVGSAMAVDLPTKDFSNDPRPITSCTMIKRGDHYYTNIWFDGYEGPSLVV